MNMYSIITIMNNSLQAFFPYIICSLCQRFGLVLFADKTASTKCELSAKGARNKHFSASKIWSPVIQWLQVAINGMIQIYGL